MILAGDIGGTNTRLAVFQFKGGKLRLRDRTQTTNAGKPSLAEIARAFIEPLSYDISVACFGVAGPVSEGHVKLTNLKWTLDEKQLAKALKIRRVALINDLVAHAEGTNVLGSRDMISLREGKPVRFGNRAILAPGTGLGEGGLVYSERTGDYRALPSEGGHCDFAPRDPRDDALLLFVRQRLGRCSWEDVLSGPGLVHIYDFLRQDGKYHVARANASNELTPRDITVAALSQSCPACVTAVEMLAKFYGAEAGNLALKLLATGGVFIGGGIAPHLIKFLRVPAVRDAFSSKGPKNIQRLLAQIPIRVITTNDGALLGAAHYATRL